MKISAIIMALAANITMTGFAAYFFWRVLTAPEKPGEKKP